MSRLLAVVVAACLALAAGPAPAQDQGADQGLAQKLANPVSDLISVPLQSNFDCCIGPNNASRYTLNVQPVVPIPLSPDLSLIVRTIVPVIDQGDMAPATDERLGFGDITQSFFFSPKPHDGFIWGVGPAFLWPIGTAGFGSGQWAAGPTFVVLEQKGPITYGLLANQLWSYAGRSNHSRVSNLFLQPFFQYTWPDTTAFSANTESSYDWVHRQWTVPFDVGLSHIFKFGPQRVQLGLLGRMFATSPEGPQAGVRFNVTFLFPTGKK
jgi:hypothetical protein